ncbi:hypothetical protein GGER_13150 [Serratia rubidaea]
MAVRRSDGVKTDKRMNLVTAQNFSATDENLLLIRPLKSVKKAHFALYTESLLQDG